MRRIAAWITRTLTVLLLGAGAAQAQPWSINIGDPPRVREQTGGGDWPLSITVSLPGTPFDADVTVDWTLIPGSATSPADFTHPSTFLTGTLVFPQFGDGTEDIIVNINRDNLDEWIEPQTFHQDEVFFIQLSNPSANAFIAKGRATITLIDHDHPLPGVQFLAATSGGILTPTQNELRWRIPGAQVQPDSITIRWNTGAGCASPGTVGGGAFGMNLPGPLGPPGSKQVWPHASSPGLQHCYSVFTMYGATPTAEVAQVKATPFDTNAGPVAWRYSRGCYQPCGAAALAPPTVGLEGIYAVDNDGIVHAMERGPMGGWWPGSWNPLSLGKPSQGRAPAVPLAGNWRLLVGTDGGGMHSVDARTGNLLWSRSEAFGNALPSLTTGTTQAQPAAILKNYGGQNDMLLVGTSKGAPNNSFRALNPATGADQDSYPDPAMGDVRGMAVVDYAGNRVLFLTASPTATLYALNLGAPLPDLSPGSLPVPLTNPNGFGSGTSGSAVMRNNRLIFGDSIDQIYAVDLLTGASYSRSTGDGQIKSFVWPDRRNNNLYFSTDNKVHMVEDMGGSFSPIWEIGSIPGLSPVLQKSGTDYLYVGDGNGHLIQINVGTQAQTLLVLEGPTVQIGAPSLDGPHGLVIVGSSTGTIHAVRVSVPYI